MKGRNSRVIAVRVPDQTFALIEKRAGKREWSVNQWLLWAVKEGLRDRHGKKG